MKLEFLENPSSTLLGYSRLSNLIQAHFWDFLEIPCWYWPDLAIFQADNLGRGRINLNFRQARGQSKKIQAANTSKLFQENPRRAWIIFSPGICNVTDNDLVRKRGALPPSLYKIWWSPKRGVCGGGGGGVNDPLTPLHFSFIC